MYTLYILGIFKTFPKCTKCTKCTTYYSPFKTLMLYESESYF